MLSVVLALCGKLHAEFLLQGNSQLQGINGIQPQSSTNKWLLVNDVLWCYVLQVKALYDHLLDFQIQILHIDSLQIPPGFHKGTGRIISDRNQIIKDAVRPFRPL